MENNELMHQDKKGPPRFVTIILLVIELLPIIWVSLILIKCTNAFIEIFKEMELPLPFMTIAFVQYWYLWIILLGVLFVTGILFEIFVKGKWRWVNVILSAFTILLSVLIVLGYIVAIFQPIVALSQALSK